MRGHKHLCYASPVLLTAVLLGGYGMIPVIAQQTTAAALRPVTATAQLIGAGLRIMSNIARSVSAQTAVTGREITTVARAVPRATPAVYSPRMTPVPRATKKNKNDPDKKPKSDSEKTIQDWDILPAATLKRLTTDQVALQRAAQKEAATAIVDELIFWKLEGRQGAAKTESGSKMGELLKRSAYEKDKVIFREDTDGTDAFVLESGRVGVFKTIDGKAVRLTTIEKGAMFGEMAAITSERRTATTIALEPCVIVRISKVTIQQKIAACDPFVCALINILINNLTRVTDRYATTNVVAEKLLAKLKATQIEKEEPAPATAAAPAPTSAGTPAATPDKTGLRGKDGGVS